MTIPAARHSPVLTLALLLITNGAVRAADTVETDSPKAVPVDQRWQLFLDDYIVARSTGFDRVVHHPRAMGVVIPADKPWESLGNEPEFFTRRQDGSFLGFYEAIWWIPDRD